MVSLLLLALQLLPVLTVAGGLIISMPNCVDRCGDVRIPYPFGIGANCYRERSFEIICNASFGAPKPFLQKFNLEVLSIDWSEYGHTVTVGLHRPSICGSDGDKEIRSIDLKGTPYRYLSNVLMMEGCGVTAVVSDRYKEIVAGCGSICDSDAANMTATPCFGIRCCQADIPGALDYFEISAFSEQTTKTNTCNALLAVIDSDSLRKMNGSLSSVETIPTTLSWDVTFSKPFQYESSLANVSCCSDYCQCETFYEGYPYVPYGCQVVKECANCEDHCAKGYYEPHDHSYYYCQVAKKQSLFRRASFIE